jgi:hypothetical protein
MAVEDLENEQEEKMTEKMHLLEERVPPLNLEGLSEGESMILY